MLHNLWILAHQEYVIRVFKPQWPQEQALRHCHYAGIDYDHDSLIRPCSCCCRCYRKMKKQRRWIERGGNLILKEKIGVGQPCVRIKSQERPSVLCRVLSSSYAASTVYPVGTTGARSQAAKQRPRGKPDARPPVPCSKSASPDDSSRETATLSRFCAPSFGKPSASVRCPTLHRMSLCPYHQPINKMRA